MKELKIGFAVGAVSMILLFTVCKKPADGIGTTADKKDNVLSAVVVFSVGESKIMHADSTEEKASLGSTLKPGDKVITGDKAKVDIQVGDGSVVRLGAKTTMDFSRLMLNDNGSADTQLALVSGKVFAKVNKAQKNDNFSVVTPTAIAGVRGTSFIMENGANNKATVKVLDGSVALAPRVPGLDNISVAEIEKKEELKKLREQVAQKEVIIEKDQSSTITSSNKGLDKKLDDDKSVTSVSSVIEKENLKVTKAETTKNEEQELKTVVTVDPKLAKQMVKLNEEAGSKLDEGQASRIEEERKKIEEQLTKQQDSEKKKFNDSIIQTPKKLETKQEIVKYYERIEKIIIDDDKKTEIIGAIINQEGNVMYVHTEGGIRKVNQNDVKEVIYDLQNKTRL